MEEDLPEYELLMAADTPASTIATSPREVLSKPVSILQQIAFSIVKMTGANYMGGRRYASRSYT